MKRGDPPEPTPDPPTAPADRPKRRARYAGPHPRAYHEKYKELNAERYAADVQKVLAAGKTPAGTHRAVMVEEVLRWLAPQPGQVAIDCTLGFGGHARAILERIVPGGRLIGLDVDALELPRTEARLRAAGFDAAVCAVHPGNFAGLPKALAEEGLEAADLILADLGVSSMQLDNPARGFSYKARGPLDMRMNPSRGVPASDVLKQLSVDRLAQFLDEYADEPDADLIARLLTAQPVETTGELARIVRAGVTSAHPRMPAQEVEASIRRTFQALRIIVNDELAALDAWLRHVPFCLRPGGRVLCLAFHSGEDRRVKKAFQAGHRAGIYAAVADEVVRPSPEEVRANPRAASAKLRWAVRGTT